MMRTFFILCTFFSISFCYDVYGQDRSVIGSRRISDRQLVSFGTGFTNFSGDLETPPSPLGYSFSFDYSYRLYPRIWFRASTGLYNISGDDSDAKTRDLRQRNLSFRATNIHSYFGIVFNAIPIYSYSSRPPVNVFFAFGFGLTSNWAKASYNGEYFLLRKLKTEGRDYSQWAPLAPVGMGVSIKANSRLSFLLESTVYFAYTDYLDDVSTVYPNIDDLPNDIARALSDRGVELGFPAKLPGMKRGNSGRDDSYLILSFKMEFLLF